LFSHEGPKSTGKLIVDEGGKEDRKDQRKKKAAGMSKNKLIEKVRISPLSQYENGPKIRFTKELRVITVVDLFIKGDN